MWSRHARGAVEVHSQCGRCSVVVRSRYTRGAVEVRSWCGRGSVVVRSRYARGAVEVCFRYAHQCGSGSVRYFNSLSDGTVHVRTYTLHENRSLHRELCAIVLANDVTVM